MTQERHPKWTLAREGEGPLVQYLDSFAESLDAQGFKTHSIDRKIRVVADFSRWLQSRAILIEAISDNHVRQFIDGLTHLSAVRQGSVAALWRLMDFLHCQGICPALRDSNKTTAVQQIVEQYTNYLRSDRGLATGTIINYCTFAESFLSERFGVGLVALDTLRGIDVINFIRRKAPCFGPARARTVTIALRSFLRYLFYFGMTRHDLADAVPSVPNWSMTSIPRAMAPDHLKAVLDGCRRDTAIGRRDYAILMLLARLGLRAGEIVALTLNDIDWDVGSIAVLGKGNRPAILPLPSDVGQALAEYLQWGRPACVSRALFLRTNAPIRGLGRQTAIAKIVAAAIRRAGVKTPRGGSHQFRHALAVDMLRHGATFTEIGSVLRHRQFKTTGIYAKVDSDALRPLSQPWPEDAPC
jgi:site-specific recombinase XerD